jgi:esterase/lipase superfamily enzyme
MPENLELPTLWKIEREADPSKHFVLKAVVPLEANDARREMAAKLDGLSSKALLIYVHGFKSGLSEAAGLRGLKEIGLAPNVHWRLP